MSQIVEVPLWGYILFGLAQFGLGFMCCYTTLLRHRRKLHRIEIIARESSMATLAEALKESEAECLDPETRKHFRNTLTTKLEAFLNRPESEALNWAARELRKGGITK